MRKDFWFLLSGLVLLAGSARADVTLINSCETVITASGEYHIAQDLTCSSTFAIQVPAFVDDVDLYFDGHTLTGIKEAVGVVVGNNSGASIHGPGTITGFGQGIELNGKGTLVVNITVNTAGGSKGIAMQGATDNTLIANTIHGQPGSIGINMLRTTNATIRANKIDGNDFGIWVRRSSTDNLLQANQAYNNSIDLDEENAPPPCANTWKSNHFATAGGVGISCVQ